MPQRIYVVVVVVGRCIVRIPVTAPSPSESRSRFRPSPGHVQVELYRRSYAPWHALNFLTEEQRKIKGHDQKLTAGVTKPDPRLLTRRRAAVRPQALSR